MTIQPISALQLFDLPIEDSEFAADPHPGLEKARKHHPWLARFSHGYVIHGHRAIRELLPQDRTCTSHSRRLSTSWARRTLPGDASWGT